jgi:hypothetical protein
MNIPFVLVVNSVSEELLAAIFIVVKTAVKMEASRSSKTLLPVY